MQGDIITEREEGGGQSGWRNIGRQQTTAVFCFLSAVNIVTSCNGYFAAVLKDAEN